MLCTLKLFQGLHGNIKQTSFTCSDAFSLLVLKHSVHPRQKRVKVMDVDEGTRENERVKLDLTRF